MRQQTDSLPVAARTWLDRVDLACILEHAMIERERGRGSLPDLLGLERASLRALLDRHFPDAELPDLDCERNKLRQDQEALSLLIRWRGGATSPERFWFADILARRAVENRHLWEDMGLANRVALTGLISRHFPRLIAANHANMRWKKFFYRQICADEGFSLCLSPSCDDCPEKDDCFAPDEPSAGSGFSDDVSD